LRRADILAPDGTRRDDRAPRCFERSRLAKLRGQAVEASTKAKRDFEEPQALDVDWAPFFEKLRITRQASEMPSLLIESIGVKGAADIRVNRTSFVRIISCQIGTK
jgi:hypothetical protein